MSLEFYSKELKGARVMATFNLPCKVYSQVGQGVCFSLKLFDLLSIHRTNTDTSLVEINGEINELLNKCGGQIQN